jgi:NADH-quinone oxidoreductase subunit N
VDTAVRFAGGVLSSWQLLAVVLLIAGFAFKMATVPLQVYAADVYQGAATPVTAFLSFIPKASGFVALLKVLYAAGGSSWNLPPQIGELIWWLAVLTMTFGNVLGLLQENVKRILAYSSISHSGYMLAGVAALVTAGPDAAEYQSMALRGVLFYLAIYGVTNIAAFGVLSLLPARRPEEGSSAETLDEIAGQGRLHVGLGLAMAVACFSLIGIPLTAGFAGKVMLIWPAYKAGLSGLVIILVVNSAISAVYYLGIVGALFLRPLSQTTDRQPAAEPAAWPLPVIAAIACSVTAMLLLGAAVPLISQMVGRVQTATQMEISSDRQSRPLSSFFSVSR